MSGSLSGNHKTAAVAGIVFSVVCICMFLRFRKPYAVYFMPCFVFCFGFWLIQSDLFPVLPESHISNFCDQGKIKITGQIISFSRQYTGKSRFILSCRRIKFKNQPEKKVCGNIYLNVFNSVNGRLPEYADTVEFRASIRSVRNFMNPGGFDYKRFLRLKKIYGTAYVKSRNLRVVNSSCDIGFIAWVIRKTEKFRYRCENFMAARTDNSDAGKILIALVTGRKPASCSSVQDLFSKAGISHILAISGFHLAILSGLFFYIFYGLAGLIPFLLVSGRARKAALAVTIVPLILYAVFTGFSASTRRALIMIIILWGAFICENENDFPSSISLAGILILIMDPGALFSISFQLSFISVIFIVEGLGIFDRNSLIFSEKLVARAGLMMLVTVLAGLGTFPLTARYFHIISPVMPLSNLILVPLTGFLVLPLGLVVLGSFSFFPGFAGALVFICEKIILLIITISEFLVSLPGAFFRTFTLQWVYIAMIYLVLAAIFFVLKAKTKPGVFCMILVPAMLIPGLVHQAAKPGRPEKAMHITVLDVGQGSSVFIQGPEGTNILVDAGGFSDMSSFDTGRYIVAPFLWQKKILSLDYVILTHPESDHLNGLVFIIENFRVRCLIRNKDETRTQNYKKFVRICRRKHIRIHHPPPEGEYFAAGGILMEFSGNRPGYLRGRLNDNGLVFRLKYGKFTMLFPADISCRREKLLCRSNGPDIRSRILLAPHHGSMTSSTNLFLDKVSPESVIISCGWHNRYGFPHPAVTARYKKRKIRIFRTDENGAVFIFTDGRDYQIKTFKEI